MTPNEKNAAKNAMAHAKEGRLSGRDVRALNKLSRGSSADERLLRSRAVSALRGASESRGLSGSERGVFNSLRRK